MAKVTFKENTAAGPSEKVVKAANELIRAADADGREFGLKRPDFLDEFRLIENLGPELAANTTYVGMLIPLLFVAEIDGEPVGLPRDKRDAEALIRRVGREGYATIAWVMGEHFKDEKPARDEKIKNEPGTPA